MELNALDQLVAHPRRQSPHPAYAQVQSIEVLLIEMNIPTLGNFGERCG